jgi:hypothetical protein
MTVTVVGIVAHLLPLPAAASNWPTTTEHGLPVCTAIGAQENPQIIPDGQGGVIITWSDMRNGAGDVDIYAQKFTSNGDALWGNQGLLVCGATGNQWEPQLCSDLAGGAIITWTDGRGTFPDIYAQRIGAEGVVHWTVNGVPVCTAVQSQAAPAIVSHRAAGAIIVWEDYRNGINNQDIYAQRIEDDGSLKWTVDGTQVCGAANDQIRPALASDLYGGAWFVWEDYRSGTNADIYVQSVNTGEQHWFATNGAVVCNASGNQTYPVVTTDGMSGAIVAWLDNRSTFDDDVYAQRVDAMGVFRWTANGNFVCACANAQWGLEIVSDDNGGAIMSWIDYRSAIYTEIYAQRVDGLGAMQWGSGGTSVCTGTTNLEGMSLAPDGAGGALIVWDDERTLINYNVYGQRLNPGGLEWWASNGLAICTRVGDQIYPVVASDGAGGLVAAWRDIDVGLGDDIRAQRIEATGYVGYPSPDIVLIVDHPADQGGNVIVEWARSYLDAFPYQVVAEYSIWRMPGGTIPSAPALAPASNRDDLIAALSAAGWEELGSTTAIHEPFYSFVAPTYEDSSASGTPTTVYMVIAHSSYFDFWKSNPMDGYSVDNLAPGAPLSLAAARAGLDVALDWSASGYHDVDLDYYRVYRSETSGFVLGPGNFLTTSPDTTLLDTSADPLKKWYYKVTAVDYNDNESDESNEAWADIVTAVGDQLPAQTFLAQNVPNPFNPATTISFGLADEGHVTLVVYDASGRRVRTLVDRRYDAGAHNAVWDGRNDRGQPVTTGIYFCRLVAGGETFTQKMLLLK